MPGYNKNQEKLIAESNASYEINRFNKNNLNDFITSLKIRCNAVRDEQVAAYNKHYSTFRNILAAPGTITVGDAQEEIANYDDLKKRLFPQHDGYIWSELSRDPEAHFQMYAIARGISIKEIANAMRNPDADSSKETLEKITGLRDDFVRMVLSDDRAAMKTTVLKYMKAVKDEFPTLLNSTQTLEDIKKNQYELFAMGNIQTLLEQDYTEKNTRAMDFREEIGEEFAASEGCTMSELYLTMAPVFMCQNKFMNTAALDVEEESETFVDFCIPLTVLSLNNSLKSYVDNAKSLNDAIKNYGINHYQSLYSKLDDMYAGSELPAWEDIDKHTAKMFNKMSPVAPTVDDAKEFLDKLNTTKRTGIFKKESDLYLSIKENLNNYINNKNGKLNTSINDLEKLQKSCEEYLAKRNPTYEDGKNRYKLINQVLRFTKDSIKAVPLKEYRAKHDEFVKDAEAKAKEGLLSGAKYESTVTNAEKRVEIARKLSEKFGSPEELKDSTNYNIAKFLRDVQNLYNDLAIDAKAGDDLVKDMFNYPDVKKEFAKIQIYEMLRAEYDPVVNDFKGEVADKIRNFSLDRLINQVSKSKISQHYLNAKENNLQEFLDTKPSDYIKSLSTGIPSQPEQPKPAAVVEEKAQVAENKPAEQKIEEVVPGI